MVIDDDLETRLFVEQILLSAGYNVLKAVEGGSGVAFSRVLPVDLVITDLIMPGVSGVETIRTFRREYPRVPIIAMSGNPDLEDILAAAQLGAVRTLAKPFRPGELLALVKAVLRAAPADGQA